MLKSASYLCLIVLCIQCVNGQNTLLVEFSGLNAAQVAGIEASLTNAGATLTIISGDGTCGASALMNPVDPVSFPKYIYNGWDGPDMDSCSAAVQTTISNNIINYVTAGGQFLYTGYDTLIHPTNNFWISLLGGASANDVTGVGSNFGSDPVCDILLNGVGADLRGQSITISSSDYDSLFGGSAAQCAPDCCGSGTQWSSLSIGSGFLTYISDGGSSDTQYNTGGQHDTAIANFIGFASSITGGDPHVQGFDGSVKELLVNSGQVLNLLSTSSSSIQVNGRVQQAPLRSKVLYLQQIGVWFGESSDLYLLIDSGNMEITDNSAEPHVALMYNSTSTSTSSSTSSTGTQSSFQELVDLSRGGQYLIRDSCRVITVTSEDKEEFEQYAIPGSRFTRQSPILRTNVRCSGVEITFEIHEFQHSVKPVEERDDILWIEYFEGRELIPIKSSLVDQEKNKWIERRIDLYMHEVENRGGDKRSEDLMSGVVGSTHPRRGIRTERHEHEEGRVIDEVDEALSGVTEFVLKSNDIFARE